MDSYQFSIIVSILLFILLTQLPPQHPYRNLARFSAVVAVLVANCYAAAAIIRDVIHFINR